MTTEPDSDNPMHAVEDLAAEMAARHQPDAETLACFIEECRALGIEPATQRVTPLIYALAVAGSIRSRK